MFDFVPLAGARWKMAHPQLEIQFIRQVLQSHFPQSATVIITAAAIGRNHQFTGSRKALLAHSLPPLPDAVGREMGRVMIDTDADPTLIVGHVVDTVRYSLAQLLV